MTQLAREGATTGQYTKRIQFSRDGADAFYPTLRARIDSYFSGIRSSRHATPWMWVQIFFYFTAWVGVYVYLLARPPGGKLALALALLFGVQTVLLAFNIGHDATHDALSDKPGVNRLLALLSLSLPGANAYLYRLIHNTPHPFPNVVGIDVTLDQVGSLLRLSPQTPVRSYHRWQHFYAPFLYSLYSLFLVFVKDFKIFARERIGNHTVVCHPASEKVSFVIFKLFYLLYALLLPLLVLPFRWYAIVGGFVLTHLVMGLLIALVLQPVHLAADLYFSQPNEDGRISRDWAVYQLEATKDYAAESRLANCLIGGLNTHVIHHLFPGICHVHYLELTRILRATCKEFGIPYTGTRFGRAVAGHFAFLRLMGRLSEGALLPPGEPALLSDL